MKRKRHRQTHYGSDSDDRLWKALATRDPYALAYVYRLESRGRPIKPYAAKWEAPESAEDLLTGIQYHLGAGEYRIIVRSGRRMLYSGIVGVGSPRQWRRQGECVPAQFR